jgi:hypothetical protein
VVWVRGVLGAYVCDSRDGCECGGVFGDFSYAVGLRILIVLGELDVENIVCCDIVYIENRVCLEANVWRITYHLSCPIHDETENKSPDCATCESAATTGAEQICAV